jgi:hypothetical protein
MKYNLLDGESIFYNNFEYIPIESTVNERSCYYSVINRSILIYQMMNQNWRGYYNKNYIEKIKLDKRDSSDWGDIEIFKVDIEEFMNGTIDLEFRDYSDDSGENFFTFNLKKFLQEKDKDLLENIEKLISNAGICPKHIKWE